MKHRFWIITALAASLLTGCVPGQVETGTETTVPTTVPATAPIMADNTAPVEDRDIVIPMKLLQSKSETVWVNWAEVELLQPESLNPQEGEPVFRIDSLQELNAFYEKWEPYFSFDWGLDETRSFDENITAYNESFFETNSLLIAYIWEGSGSCRLGLNRIYVKAGSSLYMEVKYLNNPEVGDCMMAGWFTVAEVAKEDLVEVTEYHCLRVGTSYRGGDAYMAAQKAVYEFAVKDPDALYKDALNAAPIETMKRERMFPLYRIDEEKALTDFCQRYAADGQLLREGLNTYDAAFFRGKSLIVMYVETREGSFPYAPGELIITNEGDLLADVHWTDTPVGTGRSDWLVVYEVDKCELENIRLYQSNIHSSEHLDLWN